jgi:hypothetical protein
VLGRPKPRAQAWRCRVAASMAEAPMLRAASGAPLPSNWAKQISLHATFRPCSVRPGPEAWKQLLGGEPLVLFLDELPPYLEYAVAVPVGNATWALSPPPRWPTCSSPWRTWTTSAWCCLIWPAPISASANPSLQDAFNRAVQGITSESRRIAVPITPVNPNGDELYHILRKRLFAQVAPEPRSKRWLRPTARRCARRCKWA